jgi:hypothetical protein
MSGIRRVGQIEKAAIPRAEIMWNARMGSQQAEDFLPLGSGAGRKQQALNSPTLRLCVLHMILLELTI